ncbi:MAG: hypothetical protein ACK4SX_13805 [Alcanivoracaceae bacterium]
MRIPGARQSAVLVILVVLAQTLLAWHMPSHLGDHIHPADSISAETGQDHDTGAKTGDSCPLGINGHGLALAGSAPASTSDDQRARFITPYHSHSGMVALIAPSARGPPLKA